MGPVDRAPRKNRRACPECGTTLAADVADFGGQAGHTTVVIEDFPVLACTDPSHPRLAAPEDPPSGLVDVVLGHGAFALSRTHVEDSQKCGACGARLPTPSGHLTTTTGEVRLPDHPPFRVIIEGPGAKCLHCGMEQVWTGASAGEIGDAFMTAFSRADITR
jgi:ribosomal protein S27E